MFSKTYLVGNRKMSKVISGFIKNVKGAVTVFVTLLLIPAVLISGTAVDLSRMHTTRSILQDTNQLAANSVLTQYDAMLQDVYGLFAVMESDPILGDMLGEYVKLSVFGEEGQDRGLGTFQLFYGSDVHSTTVTPVVGQNLRNVDVLRRHIEEYAKFRVPVIIVSEILDRIDKFKKVKADAEAIETKLEIDDGIDEIDKLYEKIFNMIEDINKYPSVELAAFNAVNDYLDRIKTQLEALDDLFGEFIAVYFAADEELRDDFANEYNGITQNIKSLIDGGEIKSGWVSGEYDDEGNWESGYWSSKSNEDTGLEKAISQHKDELEKYRKKFDDLIKLCEDADKKKAELTLLIDDLEKQLESGECTEEFVEGMKESGIIDEYRALLKYELEPMATAMKSGNDSYIGYVMGILDDVGYGHVVSNSLGAPRISRENLRNGGNVFFFTPSPTGISTSPLLNLLVNVTAYKYTAPGGFKEFQDSAFESTKNAEFYKMLEERYGSAGSEAKKVKKEKEKEVAELLKEAQDLYKKLSLTPEGAKYYKAEGGTEDGSGFGGSDDWGDGKKANNKAKDEMKGSILSQFGNLMAAAGDKIILLTYVSEMFSDFTTTTDPETKTMAGIPMGTDMNYFFQSELEYLYHGNEESARSNIAVVSSMIFLIRFVFNYISTFAIGDINAELTSLAAPALQFAPLVRELLRLGYALAETAVDMGKLLDKPGRSVPVMKLKIDQWTISLKSGVAAAFNKVAAGPDDDKGSRDSGMFYKDYLRIFLLFKNGDVLADRTADLISWNITNKKEGINADEAAMSAASLFDMSQCMTDFSITTTVDMRMLFLSMPFAQRGINGVIPPRTMPVTLIDHRGY